MKAIVVSEKQFTILFDALMHKLELDALKARKELTVDDLHGKLRFRATSL